MVQSLEFQQAHLDKVSRSFAFCIRRLPQPLGRWVGLTYLLCRILDTIEDTEWPTEKDQSFAFDGFENAVLHAESVAALNGWEVRFNGLNTGEAALLTDAHFVLQDLHALPDNVKISVQDLVLSMSSGMRHFVRHRKNGLLRLGNLAEVNQYCFFVAGLVGEALTHLVASVEPRFPVQMPSLLRAHHFGLFLQKVNILKDQVKDEKSGRWLVPSREQVEESARSNAEQALDFLCSIPKEQVEFRQFCAWSLFLGLETLRTARASFWRRTLVKISRAHTQKLLAKVDSMIIDNKKLREFFFSQAKRLNWEFSSNQGKTHLGQSPEWLPELYRGQLDSESLVKLGLGAI
jgi:phytoene/squalene synthetase